MDAKTPTLTIFTATYNRGHLIQKLYESLLRQKNFDFEWLVVDDGSEDGTPELFEEILLKDNPFKVRYYKQGNKGLISALNRGIQLARGQFLSKIDSDDYLAAEYSSNVLCWIDEIRAQEDIYGVGGLRVNQKNEPLAGSWPMIDENGYVDASDIERKNYNLDADMSEAWRVDILRQYPFSVWPGEKFAPEQITFFKIALDGYKIRWRSVPIQICEYQEGGLTRGAFNLQKNNPMGYAMMYNQLLDLPNNSFIVKLKNAIQMFAMSFVGKHPLYGFKRRHLGYRVLALIPGFLLSIRRYYQYNKKNDNY